MIQQNDEKQEGTDDVSPEDLMKKIYAMKNLAKQLRDAFELPVKDISEISDQVSNLERKVQGIRAALDPASLYALMETAIKTSSVTTSTRDTELNMHIASLMGVTLAAPIRPSKPIPSYYTWRCKKNGDLELLGREGLTGLARLVEKSGQFVVSDWRVSRNPLNHNAGLLDTLHLAEPSLDHQKFNDQIGPWKSHFKASDTGQTVTSFQEGLKQVRTEILNID